MMRFRSDAVRGPFLPLVAGLGCLFASVSARAEGPWLSEPPVTETPAIAGGAEAETCAFPAVVVGPSACSATLIHPRVVLCAAHCSGNINSVRFSETANGGGRTVPVQYCSWYDGYQGNADQGDDWSFCVLAEPVTDIPIIPPAVGCEADVGIGQTVLQVGYGDSFEGGGWGTKRYAQTEITNVMEDKGTIYTGPNSSSACPGDSGGPLLIKYPDESWRTVGIASTLSGDCGSPGAFNAYAMVKNAIPWVEETSGIDVTPCHDADGTWNPGPECGGFWTGLNEGNGTWNNWCSGTPSGGPSFTCGPDYTQSPEADLPTVSITSPGNGAEFMSDPDIGAAPITIVAEADDGSGWGIKQTELLIDGQAIPGGVRTSPPYEWGANFPSGAYELQVRAIDGWDNEGLSNVVTVYIDQDAPESTGSSDSGGSGGGEEGTGSDTGGSGGTGDPGGSGDGGEVGTGDEGGLDQDGGGGCSLAGPEQGSPVGVLALLGLLGLRRRD